MTKISDLPAAATATLNDSIPIVQGGQTKKATLSQVRGLNKKANKVWAPIFFRGCGINGTGSSTTITATGTPGANTMTIGWTPANIPIMATKVVFANFDMAATGEADRPSTNVWSNFAATLNFQNVNSVSPSYTFNGARTTTLNAPQNPLPHGYLMKYPLPFPLPANNSFGIRAAGQLPGTATYNLAGYAGVSGGNGNSKLTNAPSTPGSTAVSNFTEFEECLATGWTNKTQSNSNVKSTSGSSYSHTPAIVLGLMHLPLASVAILGDSLDQGQNGGVPDNLCNVSWLAQSLRNTIPWVNFSRGSVRVDQFDTFAEAKGLLSLILGTNMYLTDVLVGFGRNDINSNTASVVQASVSNCALSFQQQGIPVHIQTIPPWTASTDAWATTANQFYVYANPQTPSLITIGSTSFSVASSTGITLGMLVALDTGAGITPGTTVTGSSGTTITISQATIADIAASTAMNFGSSPLNN